MEIPGSTPQPLVHTMLDIETWGNKMILSIGAVKFNADEILDRFTVGIDPVNSQRHHGGVIDAGTMLWWLDPKRDEARAKLAALPKIELFYALEGLAIFVAETPAHQRGSCWGKGSTFDNVIVKEHFDRVGLEYPFTYRQDECYRTMANRCPEVEYEQIGLAHVEIADAESQAVHLQRICKHLGIAL